MFNFLIFFIKFFVIKNRLLCFVWFFDILVFHLVLIKLEIGFQKNNLSSVNLGLI